jgi:hypothetical protein
MGTLKVRTSAGLFDDFLKETDNRICMHARSSAVDWRFNYDLPPTGKELTLDTLMSIVPDLSKALSGTAHRASYASINEMSYSEHGGFLAKVNSKQFECFRDSYTNLGYVVNQNGELSQIRADSQIFQASTPQFMHSYVDKMFHSIPSLYIVKPIDHVNRFSQLAITYVLSYFLGMLTRYFPTHWIALHSGAKGDGMWPAAHATQRYVELAFPELTIELIHDIVAQSNSKP